MKDRIIKDMWTLFKTKKEKRNKETRKTEEINDRLFKDRIIRGIRTHSEPEKVKDYCTPEKVSNFCNNDFIEYESNMKMVIQIET